MTRMSDTARKAALAADLKAMFKSLEARPIPGGIRSVVDQLDQGSTPSDARIEAVDRKAS